MTARIRRDDEVIMLTGKDKDGRNEVRNVLSSGKVIVEGVNPVEKHQKPVPALNQPGDVVKKKAVIQIPNLATLNATTDKVNCVDLRFKNSKEIRFSRSNSETIG